MASPVNLTGHSASDPIPGRYFETSFAQGPASGAAGPRRLLLLGNRGSAGTATVDTMVYGPDTDTQAQTEAQVIALFGSGSPLHRAFMRITAITPDVPVYFCAVTASAGTASSGTIVLTNAAVNTGVIRVWVGDEYVDTSVAVGAAVIAQATLVVASINAMIKWPVTAANAAGASATITLTAKIPGPRGDFIRYMASIVNDTANVGTQMTVSATTDAALSAGATPDSNTAALATILAQRFYHIVSEAEDATQFGNLVLQMNTQQSANSGIRQRAFTGSVGTTGATTTIATGRNAARAEFVWQKNSLWTPFELAANNAAIYMMEEAGDSPELSFVGYGNDEKSSKFWRVPPPRDIAAHPTRTDIGIALNNGYSPIAVNSRGNGTYLVDRITSRSLSGSTPDYRIRDAHKVSVVDFFVDALDAKTALQFGRKRIADNPLKGQRFPGEKVVFPDLYKGCIFGLIDEFDNKDMLQDAQKIKDGLYVGRADNPRTALEARIGLRPIDLCKQFLVACDQVA